ncbi:hypothetical protein BD410DRAFT_553961 [Rickenella mellea]|uniref:Uncharacterized protein n=1 Tax=Rickenella mellea TaxID=50990 RepID=A0A4Y7PPI8_9AGAM|nr:hypothetical protein BD410DRAFT_553961 [Rickenella mellea]
MKDSVQSLRRLSRNDAYYSAHEVLERMETETNRVADGFWGAYVAGKARSLFHIIISLIVASAVLVWGVLNNGDWQMGLLSPWLVGSTTWLALRYERNPSPVTLNGIAWKIGKTIHTAVLGIMCLDFLIGQLSVDLAFPRLFPFGLPTGFGTAQGKATRRDL